MRALTCFSFFACVLGFACAAEKAADADQSAQTAPTETDDASPDVANAAPDAGEDVARSSSTRPPLPRYSVPVESGSELEAFSYYPVTIASGEVRRGTLKLKYPFPVFLAGITAQIELEGPYQPGQTHVEVAAGQYGKGTCDLTDGVWVCTEQLPGVQVDRAAAKAAMEAAGVATAEITRRLEVTERFSIDPIGVFEIDASAVSDRNDD